MITVKFHKEFCIIRYGENSGVVSKPLGEAIQKLVTEHRQLKEKIGGQS